MNRMRWPRPSGAWRRSSRPSGVFGFRGRPSMPRLTGNPVRPAITALAQTSYVSRPDQAFGFFSGRIAAERSPTPFGFPGIRCGRGSLCSGHVHGAGEGCVCSGRIAAELSPFFADVPARLVAAHLVIARRSLGFGGSAGRPSSLGAAPGAIDDHQSRMPTAWRSGAWMVPQPRFTSAFLAERLGIAGRPLASHTGSSGRARSWRMRCGGRVFRPIWSSATLGDGMRALPLSSGPSRSSHGRIGMSRDRRVLHMLGYLVQGSDIGQCAKPVAIRSYACRHKMWARLRSSLFRRQ